MRRTPTCIRFDRDGAAESARDSSTNPDSIDLAALARMNFSGQSQVLSVPRIGAVPASYSHTTLGDISLQVAEDMARLGLGSLALWRKHGGNALAFISESVNKWLQERSSRELDEETDFGLYLSSCVEDDSDREDEEGWVFLRIETKGCGTLVLGGALEALDSHAPGLSEAFYSTLMSALHQWVETYDITNAADCLDCMEEGIRGDMGEECALSLQDYCKQQDTRLPDLEWGIPAYVRHPTMRPRRRTQLLRKHAEGPYADWVNAVVDMQAAKSRAQAFLHECGYEWEEGPLPSWVVYMREGDAIRQCFDEESRYMYEPTRAPSCLYRYRPGDTRALRSVLADIERFLRFARDAAHLSQSIQEWSDHASQCRPRAVSQPCA